MTWSGAWEKVAGLHCEVAEEFQGPKESLGGWLVSSLHLLSVCQILLLLNKHLINPLLSNEALAVHEAGEVFSVFFVYLNVLLSSGRFSLLWLKLKLGHKFGCPNRDPE